VRTSEVGATLATLKVGSEVLYVNRFFQRYASFKKVYLYRRSINKMTALRDVLMQGW
jgi:hypothetical protein